MTDDELEKRGVVTVFLRHEAAVLLLRRSADVGSDSGQWGGVAGHTEGDPDAAARREIREKTGLGAEAVTLVRAGDPFEATDPDLGTPWVVHPFLFDAATRAVEPDDETTAYEWVPPTEIRRRETVPDLWGSYDRVRPTIETVRNDREHGSASLSVRALEALRDEAALAGESGDATDTWPALADLARDLGNARPAMPVVENRVNRAMAAASDERTAAGVERAAGDEIDRALAADERAAARAAERLPARVATLSRSGTVHGALRRVDPDAVLVAESRPGREGVDTAERLARETTADVTITTDAAFAGALADADAEALVVGADAVRPDGSVLNKVGTRGATAAAAREKLECLVVAASDKVLPADGDEDGPARVDREERDPAAVYDGPADVAVANPTFGLTPADRIDAVVTEDGVLDAADVREVADRHRDRSGWD